MSGYPDVSITFIPVSGGLSLRDGQGAECPAHHHQPLDVDHRCAPEGLEPSLLLPEVPTPGAAFAIPMSLLALHRRTLPHHFIAVGPGAPLPSRLQLVFVRMDVDGPALPRLLDASAHQRASGAGSGREYRFCAVSRPKAREPRHLPCRTSDRACLQIDVELGLAQIAG